MENVTRKWQYFENQDSVSILVISMFSQWIMEDTKKAEE